MTFGSQSPEGRERKRLQGQEHRRSTEHISMIRLNCDHHRAGQCDPMYKNE